MILEEVFPNNGKQFALTELDKSALKSLYPPVSGFRFNNVISPIGDSVNSDFLSNDLDRMLLRHIRSVSDLIVTSGLTARLENLKASRFAPMLILTKSRETFSIPALEHNSTNAVYITQPLGTEYKNEKAMAIGMVDATSVEFCESFCRLNEFSHVVIESGPSIAREFVAADLLNEIDITVTKTPQKSRAMSEAESFLSDLGVGKAELLQTLKHEDTWFFRFGSPRENH